MTGTAHAVIGRGTSAYTSAEVVAGPVRWLDSPDAVLDLVGSGRIGEYIAISRGGTTTFMAPALAAGVRGLLTLQGMPTSHLGILSREFGIPCVMSVVFTDGVSTERGETVPADDTVVRLDISGTEGAVLLG
ncbi:PEP-utilizing enzyme [Actinomycetospora rhizophila]|uniref:PEP-utilizing enzyme n=1 Tax=Actinomycetospora rhizophila TaxID=1416876 RepID=A0ABV9ZCZ2_9PSEU